MTENVHNDVLVISNTQGGSSTFQRKKAAERLLSTITTKVNGSGGNVELEKLWTECLSSPLIALVSDQTERCRVIALSILKLLVEHIHNVVQTQLAQLLQSCEIQLGKEEVEEVRVDIVALIDIVVTSCSDVIVSQHCERLVAILRLALTDKNHHQIEQTCNVITHLAQKIPTRMILFTGSLNASLIRHLPDRHQRIRSASLLALTEFVSCGAVKVVDNIAEQLYLLAIDHSPSVRITLSKCIARWLTSDVRLSIREHKPLLNMCLLSLLASNVPDVIVSAQESLLIISSTYFASKMGDTHNPLPPCATNNNPGTDR
ncbi:hypothetical protein SAMD00019534_106950 [Acytostelium subglobosum LB1]|uniref:hypothetical protein n=1 Tax=Acytostelium subglobosum LB1 TaxID=1410327 RepID=UPI0006451EFB|nr:hypothetical protein SAMD00019534_106950 [Acytostelium subglobosum LB1]GAM27519.1 hypothetical protein SAMD00019534_106950 [Acytostelium subglobosum LB1]|eukprot:XP_012749584.1 hypothetical protein SAMD00019534_106950 [Acytostelium subglobosum LB1]